MRPFLSLLLLPSIQIVGRGPLVRAHISAYYKGMYCFNGTSGRENRNTNEAVVPLFRLPFSQWWMSHHTKCDEFPPALGDSLELPAGGSFTVELAGNRAQTSFSYDGTHATDWPDGRNHPADYSMTNSEGDPPSPSHCLGAGNMHTRNKTMAAGTVFAISYQSDIKKVTPNNLVVFTVRYHTPWKRLTTYDVPAGLPECPPGGCHCVWGWIPNHCGTSNMYLHPGKCHVTGSVSKMALAPPSPPVWCEDDSAKCVAGAKQMVYWAQADGNNVSLDGYQRNGQPKSPGYNMKMGFKDGAQNDIFMPVADTSKDRTLVRSPKFIAQH